MVVFSASKNISVTKRTNNKVKCIRWSTTAQMQGGEGGGVLSSEGQEVAAVTFRVTDVLLLFLSDLKCVVCYIF